jgi:hypothetical protein
MMRGRAIRRSMLTALAAVTTAAGFSCAPTSSGEPSIAGDTRPTLNAPTRSDRPSSGGDDLPATDAQRLADQAARDAEQWARLQQQRANDQPQWENDPDAPAGRQPSRRADAGGAPAVGRSGPGQIRWEGEGTSPPPTPRPDRRAQAGDSADDENATGGESPESSALGREEPGDVEVEPFSEATDSAAESDDGAEATDVRHVLTPDQLDMLLVEVRRQLFRKSIDSDQPMRELIGIAMMSLIDPEVKLEPEAFRDLTDGEREQLEQLQSFFRALGERLDGSRNAEEVIVDAVLELEKGLIKQPELHLPTAALCWRVGGFGDYNEFQPLRFLAQSEQKAILYLEIDGFTSELNKKGQWVTEVSQQLEIYSDRDGIPVWSEPWQKAADVTNNKRHDFFTTQIITLPKALSVGRYHLKIRARDEKTGAEAERSIAFEMVADPKLAAKVPEK